MRWGGALLAGLLALLLPAAASADPYKAAYGVGPLHASRGGLWGARLDAEWTLTDGLDAPTGNSDWTIGAGAEASFATGTRDGSDLSQVDLMVGPRYTQVGYGGPWRLQPFVEALVGTMHENDAGGRTLLTGAFGLGIDVPLGPLQPTGRRVAVVLRAQYSKRWVNEDTTDFYDQFSASVVLRLGRRP